ncbi:hypothetical protein HDU93_004456 [Gonapodya sp. JEL0774]|nr:hypothetical protein HDU93_004456 [Gonapodya sp. JEL0774]
MRVASFLLINLALASASIARPFPLFKAAPLSLQNFDEFSHLLRSGDLLSSVTALESEFAVAPMTCVDPNADLPVKGEFAQLAFPISNVTLIDIETKGRAIGNVSISVVTLPPSPTPPSSPSDPSEPVATEPEPISAGPNVTFSVSLSANTPALLASLMLTPPTLVLDPLTGILTFNLTTPTKFLVPTDCAIVKVKVTVPKSETAVAALKVRAAMMGIDVTGTGAASNPDDTLDFQSLDLMSVFGNVGISQAKVNTTVSVLGVNGAVSGDSIYAGVNVTYIATRGAVSLVDSKVNGNVSLTSVLASVVASQVSFNGSFNASSRLGDARAGPITILKDPAYVVPTSVSVWSVLGAAYVEISDPFDGPFNASSGFMSAPVITDTKNLITVVPGIYPAKVSGFRGLATGSDSAEVSSKVGASTLKFIG